MGTALNTKYERCRLTAPPPPPPPLLSNRHICPHRPAPVGFVRLLVLWPLWWDSCLHPSPSSTLPFLYAPPSPSATPLPSRPPYSPSLFALHLWVNSISSRTAAVTQGPSVPAPSQVPIKHSTQANQISPPPPPPPSPCLRCKHWICIS